MRVALLLSFAIFTVTVMAADEPAPLLKPVVPPSTGVRIHVPVVEERGVAMQFKAQVPRAKGKSETIDVTVGIETLPGPSFVSSKLWKSWGYETPANGAAVLPELIILGSQIPAKPVKGKESPKESSSRSKGYDVQARIPSIRLEVIDPPGGAEKIRGCDLFITLKDLTKGADATFQPRFYFADKFIELTVPSGAVKRPGTGDEAPPEPMVASDAGLEVITAPMTFRGMPLFKYSSVDGPTQYKTADGKVELVNVGVSSTNDWPSGVLMTMGAARGCKVDLDPSKEVDGMGAAFNTKIAVGKVKELRLGAMTGAGLKTPKDIVIRDLEVYVDKSSSGHFMWVGPRFLETYFTDAVYACGPDGVWNLHARIKPDLLQDVKTRPKK